MSRKYHLGAIRKVKKNPHRRHRPLHNLKTTATKIVEQLFMSLTFQLKESVYFVDFTQLLGRAFAEPPDRTQVDGET